MKVEAYLNILENKTEIWTTITNIKDFQKILSSVEKIEILTEPTNGLVGLKWLETRMYFGKPTAINKWITDAVEDKFYKTRAEMDGFIFLTTMTISAFGDTTRLTSSHETKSQGIIAKLKSLPMFFFKGMLKKTILKDLSEIKAAIEHK
jgi:hypothetical protein